MFRLLLSRQFEVRSRHWPVRKSRLHDLAIVHSFLSDEREINTARCFHSTSRDSRLRLNSDNVVSSSFPDVKGFEKTLFHELIWENMDKWSDKTALVCSLTGRSYTYHRLRQLTGRLATSLRKAKLFPRDTVATILPNVPEYAIIVLAASEAGLRTTLLNPMYTSMEIAKQLNDSEASAIFTTPRLYSNVKQSIKNNPRIRLPIVVVNDGTGPIPSDAINLDDLMRDDIEEFSKTNEKTETHAEDDIFLPYSSGTTGLPKGVQLCHRNIVANLMQLGCPETFSGIETSESEQDVVPVILPIFHIYGLAVVLCNFLRMGAKLVCVAQFSAAEYIKVLEHYKPTMLYLVPPLVQMMALNEGITPRHAENVRLVMSGAAPIGEEFIAIFRKRISDTVRFIQGYGLTETSPAICISRDAPPESVGYLMPNTQMRIVRHEGEGSRNVGVNEVGEIYLRGPQVMKGYFKNPDATRNVMEGDWFKTGDLARINEEGMVYIQGRLKELIKVKGFQVAPAELEDIIRGFEKIQDVAVIGVPHEKYGEIPKAFIVPKKGITVHSDELKDYVAKRVAEYKRLGHVQLIEQIPKSAAGKVLKRELQKM